MLSQRTATCFCRSLYDHSLYDNYVNTKCFKKCLNVSSWEKKNYFDHLQTDIYNIVHIWTGWHSELTFKTTSYFEVHKQQELGQIICQPLTWLSFFVLNMGHFWSLQVITSLSEGLYRYCMLDFIHLIVMA